MKTRPQQTLPTDHDGDYVEFFRAGTRAKGMFQCVSCRRVVVSFDVLGGCASCGEKLWEHAEWSPFEQGR
jgi:hypothetical protein